jgi:hypothetical protein
MVHLSSGWKNVIWYIGKNFSEENDASILRVEESSLVSRHKHFQVTCFPHLQGRISVPSKYSSMCVCVVSGAFRLYDVDNDGFITRDEMYNIVDAIYQMVVRRSVMAGE